MPTLSREDALAFDDHYAEFQEGRVIIRVDFPPHGEHSRWLARASVTFDLVWQDLPKIVAFARAHLSSMQFKRWRQYDLAGISAHALIAYGIWIDPADGSSTCHVSYNPAASIPAGLPELTEEDAVMVDRSASGWLTIASARHSSDKPARWKLPQRCPCCYCWTLEERAAFFICRVCQWEDDGQDDHDADEASERNDGLTLLEARANYRAFGASRRDLLPHARPPRLDELP